MDCLLLYYDVIHSIESGKGVDSGDGEEEEEEDDEEQGGTDERERGMTLQFMFQPDLNTEDGSSSLKIGHHYTKPQGRYLSSIKAIDDEKMLKQMCIRTTHRLINQRVMRTFIPIRVTRPESIFTHFGQRSNAEKNNIFASIRGLHIPEPSQYDSGSDSDYGSDGGEPFDGDSERYKTLYEDHRRDILLYDSSFRELDRGNGASYDANGVFGVSRSGGATVPRGAFVSGDKASFSVVKHASYLEEGRETWNDEELRDLSSGALASELEEGTPRAPFIRSDKFGSAHYRPGYVLDLFCHDSQRSKWSFSALKEALDPIAELGNAKPSRLAAADLLNHFKVTIDLVVSKRNYNQDYRTVSILKALCQQHGLFD